jgi:hypothetical protein
MLEPQTLLAFSSDSGVQALQLGSGISFTSGIPTGWNDVVDLIRKTSQLNEEE